MAGRIVKIMCLKSLLGEKFDACVSCFIKENDPYAPDILGRLTDRFILPTREKSGFIHITNVHAYSELNPDGAERGHNVYQAGDDLYMGFDSALFGKGSVPKKAIEDSFYQAFMNISWVKSRQHYLKDKKRFLDERQEYQKFLETQSPRRQFDPQRIQAFLDRGELPNKWWERPSK